MFAIFSLYILIAITAQKLMRKPEDITQKGSAVIITREATLSADTQSRIAKIQMLIKAALVTESLQPVRQPISKAKTAYMKIAFFRLILRVSSIMGSPARKPAK